MTETMKPLHKIDEILRQPAGNILLRAGAGTGKTYNLTKRVLNLLTGNGTDRFYRLDEILALTFTDLAASEMRHRIYREISDTARETTDSDLREHLLREKREFGKNYIQTFHAFCSRLLRLYPDELSELEFPMSPDETDGDAATVRLEGSFELLDSYTGAALQLDLTRDFYRIYKDSPTLRNQLMTLGRRNFELIAGQLCSLPDEVLSGLSSLGIRAFLDRLKGIAQGLYAESEERYRPVREMIAAHQEWFKEPPGSMEVFVEQFITTKDTIRLAALEKEFKATATAMLNPLLPDLKGYYDLYALFRDYLQTPEDELVNRIESLQENDGYNLDDAVWWNLRELGDLALRWKYFMRYHRIAGRNISFDDLIDLTSQLLDKNPRIARDLKSRFRYILIDEFQDTDRRQWDIVRRISRYDSDGNLMIVGDMKQAIYRFRGGDVTMIQRVERELHDLSTQGVPLYESDLPYSFRSNSALINYANTVFDYLLDSDGKTMFDAAPGSLGLPPEQLRAAHQERDGIVTVLGYDADRFDRDQLPEEEKTVFESSDHYLEGLRIARLLHEIREGRLDERYKDIREKMTSGHKAVGILLRYRTHLQEIEDALKLYDIPYTIISGRGFFNSQEVYDVYHLLAFLLDSFDDLALAGVLRSPAVGLSDAGLLALKVKMHEQHLSSFWETLTGYDNWYKEWLIEPDCLALETAVPVLKRLRDASRVSRVSELVETMLRETAFTAGFSDRQQVLENLHKLTDMIRNMEQQGRGNLFEIVRFLRFQMDESAQEQHAELPESGSVQIMTVHGAKGLEFPMVILPDMNAKPNNKNAVFVSPSDKQTDHFPLVAYKDEDKESESNKNDGSLIYRYLRLLDNERNLAELKRLFYVAVTRAESHLVLCDTYSYSGKNLNGQSFNKLWRDWFDQNETDGLHDLRYLDEGEWRELYGVLKNGLPEPVSSKRSEIRLLESESLDKTMAASRIESVQATSGEKDETQLLTLTENAWKQLPPDKAGTMIHQLIELQVSQQDMESVIRFLLLQEGFDPEDPHVRADSARLRQHVSHIREWLEKNFPGKPQMRREVAFECLLDEGETPEYVRGTIDLLVRDEQDRWFIVDFKTGRVKEDRYAELAGLAGYDRQLRIYSQAVKRISAGDINVDPDRALLLFSDPDGCRAMTLRELGD